MTMTGIECEVWGAGSRVVLVHGSLSVGPVEWEGQRPLADEGYQLVVPTRRAYVPSSGTVGEDFLVDGEDIAGLLGDGAHLVGHSYGALAAMVAAAARPQAVHSLVLAEPPHFDVADGHPEVTRMRDRLREVCTHAASDSEFLVGFLEAVGIPIEEIPPEELGELTAMVPAVRLGRLAWEGNAPADPLVGAPFPVVVVSGNHHAAFTAICEALTSTLGARLRVVEGAGHEMQMMTGAFNTVLLELWRSAG